MVGEAVDCLKTVPSGNDSFRGTRASVMGSIEGSNTDTSDLIASAERLLITSQQGDGGWQHDEGSARRHHATFVSLWGLR